MVCVSSAAPMRVQWKCKVHDKQQGLCFVFKCKLANYDYNYQYCLRQIVMDRDEG